MTITADQLRAARALVKMEQRVLADTANVPVQTLKRYEGGTGPLSGNYQNIAAIIRVLEAAGVTFLSSGDTKSGGPGVRLTAGDPRQEPYGLTGESAAHGDPPGINPSASGKGGDVRRLSVQR